MERGVTPQSLQRTVQICMRCLERRWRERLENALVVLSRTPKIDNWQFLVPHDAVRIAQEHISPKDAPRNVGQYYVDQNLPPINFIQFSIAPKDFTILQINDEVDS